MENKAGNKMDVSYLAKHTIKDSVFTNLFKDKKYALQLYQSIHPEDGEITEDEIGIVTLENVLLNNPYNDLGFTVGSRLLILVEAQSTWSVNILVRGLLYLAQTIQEYILETKQNIYKSKKVTIPEPELYVIYTGDRVKVPELITLSEEFFAGRHCAIDVSAGIIRDGKDGDIIYQYVAFTKVYQEQRKLHGRTKKAVTETLRICKDADILKEYLLKHEKEVVDIMMSLFDKEQILTAYIHEEREEGWKEGREEGKKEGREEGKKEGREEGRKEVISSLIANGMNEELVANSCGMSVQELRKWLE